MVSMKIQRQMLADEAYEIPTAQLTNPEIVPAEKLNLDALSNGVAAASSSSACVSSSEPRA
jgi:hypothetical protein